MSIIDNFSYMDATETCRVLAISRRYWPTDTIHELASWSRKGEEAAIGAPQNADQAADQQPAATGGAQ